MAKIKLVDIPKPAKPYPSLRSVLGRAVISHSPDKHPEQGDPLAKQPDITYAEGGATATGGSVSYNAQRNPKRRF